MHQWHMENVLERCAAKERSSTGTLLECPERCLGKSRVKDSPGSKRAKHGLTINLKGSMQEHTKNHCEKQEYMLDLLRWLAQIPIV